MFTLHKVMEIEYKLHDESECTNNLQSPDNKIIEYVIAEL